MYVCILVLQIALKLEHLLMSKNAGKEEKMSLLAFMYTYMFFWNCS